MKMLLRKVTYVTLMVALLASLILLITGCTEPPAVGLTADKAVILVGESVQFSDLSTGEITSWLWDFGDGTTSAEQNPLHIFTKSGDFLVTFTVSNKGGASTIETSIRVLQPPVATLAASKAKALAGENIQFKDNSTGDIDSYLWDFGDGTTSNERNAPHIFRDKGNYTVSLKVSNELSSDVKTAEVNIVNPVKADFSASSTLVGILEEIQFTDNSTGDITSYSWDFGDLTVTSSEQNPSHMYRRAEDFTVSLTVSNELSSDTKTMQVRVIRPVRADFSVEKTKAKAGEAIQFNDESEGVVDTWSWDFGDGSTNTQQNPTHTYDKDGFYTVTLEVTNAVSSDKVTRQKEVTIASLKVGLIFCSDYNSKTGEYNLYPEAEYSQGDTVALFVAVENFEQKDVSDGKEIWVKFEKMLIYMPDISLVLSHADLLEVHETVEPLSLFYFVLPVMEIDEYDSLGEYRVEVLMLDKLSGNMGIESASFTVK